MRAQPAITTITYAATVAGGVFAPGHLGELTQSLPFELAGDVLAETRTVQRRLRALPSRAGVYFVLALGMFPHLGYLRVWGKLTAGLAGLEVPRPSEKALRDLRRRISPAPLKAPGTSRKPTAPARSSGSPARIVTGIESALSASEVCGAVRLPPADSLTCGLLDALPASDRYYP